MLGETSTIYQHFLGNLYVIKYNNVLHTEEEVNHIVYSNLITCDVYCRPQDMFNYKLNSDKPRFEAISPDVLTHWGYMTDFCVAYDLHLIKDGDIGRKLLNNILRGEGWTPYNQLSLANLETIYFTYFSEFKESYQEDQFDILDLLKNTLSVDAFDLVSPHLLMFVTN